MAHTYEELHGMTVAQLREVAEGVEHDAVHGYSTMHKEELLPTSCRHFNRKSLRCSKHRNPTRVT